MGAGGRVASLAARFHGVRPTSPPGHAGCKGVGLDVGLVPRANRGLPVRHEPSTHSHARCLPWPVLPAAVPFLYLWIAWSWWVETRAQLESLPDVTPGGHAGVMALAAVIGRIPTLFAETAGYVLWWRARGLRLPFWRFLCCVATLSTCDLLGYSIRRAAEGAPDALRVIGAVLAGPTALDSAGGPATGAAAAFGSLGVLTITRVVTTAWAQARGIGRPIAGPLLFTTVAWLLTRLVAWWSVDLVRGLSPVP
jgi:hypothetical protein